MDSLPGRQSRQARHLPAALSSDNARSAPRRGPSTGIERRTPVSSVRTDNGPTSLTAITSSPGHGRPDYPGSRPRSGRRHNGRRAGRPDRNRGKGRPPQRRRGFRRSCSRANGWPRVLGRGTIDLVCTQCHREQGKPGGSRNPCPAHARRYARATPMPAGPMAMAYRNHVECGSHCSMCLQSFAQSR